MIGISPIEGFFYYMLDTQLSWRGPVYDDTVDTGLIPIVLALFYHYILQIMS